MGKPNGFESASPLVGKSIEYLENTEGVLNVPDEVLQFAKFADGLGLSLKIGPNIERTGGSCEMAVSVRASCVGSKEVRLHEEVQSLANGGKIIDKEGRPVFVIVHSRANRMVDKDKLLEIVNDYYDADFGKVKVKSVSLDTLKLLGDSEKGKVNPLIEARRENFDVTLKDAQFLHIVDGDLEGSISGKNLASTNALHRDWQSEFKVDELFGALEGLENNTVIRGTVDAPIDVVVDGPSPVISAWKNYQSLVLGLLGYDEKSITLFKKFLTNSLKSELSSMKERNYKNGKNPISIPVSGSFTEFRKKIELTSNEFGLIRNPEGFREVVVGLLVEYIKVLVNQKASIICLPCNILSNNALLEIVIQRLRDEEAIDADDDLSELVTPQGALTSYLSASEYHGKNLLVLGGEDVSNPHHGTYAQVPSGTGVFFEYLDQKDLGAVDDLLTDANIGKTVDLSPYVSNFRDVDGVILAGTSFSVAVDEGRLSLPADLIVVDTMEIYAKFCGRKILEQDTFEG